MSCTDNRKPWTCRGWNIRPTTTIGWMRGPYQTDRLLRQWEIVRLGRGTRKYSRTKAGARAYIDKALARSACPERSRREAR